jgi:RES domain-containing protein
VILWRVSRHHELNGDGGLHCHGRWHTRGRRIVYCTENPATALLENIVHMELDPEDWPGWFDYLEIEAPDTIPRETLSPELLPAGWQSSPGATQSIGDNWLRSAEAAILAVPCVVVPKTVNFLINPAHPASAAIKLVQVHRHPRDTRIPASAR